MSKYGWILLAATTVMGGCVMLQRDGSAPAQSQPVSATALSQECSDLRADIASGQYRQRSQPARSSSSVIADAENAKAEQRIEALRQRYEALDCAKLVPDAGLQPSNH